MSVGYTDIKAYQAKITNVPATIAALLHNSSVILRTSLLPLQWRFLPCCRFL